MRILKKKDNYWRLYRNTEKDISDYKASRGIQSDLRIITNPIPEIIDIDISLIKKNIKITGYGQEVIKSNDAELQDEILKSMLIDGIGWLEIQIIDDKPTITPLKIGEVSEIEYDLNGNIIQITIRVTQNNFQTTKKYYIDRDGIPKIQITTNNPAIKEEMEKAGYDSNNEKINIYGFVPVIELAGPRTDSEANVSRVDGILDIIEEINEFSYSLKGIYQLHGEPYLAGNENFSDEDLAVLADNQVEEEETTDPNLFGQIVKKNGKTIKYIPLSEGGNIQYVEMKGAMAEYWHKDTEDKLERLNKKYPELLMAELMQGSAMSGYAVYLKLISLTAIIENYRNKYKTVLIKLFEFSSLMEGIQNNTRIEMGKIIQEATIETVNMIISVYQTGLIDKETAINKISDLLELDSLQVLENLKNPELQNNNETNIDGINMNNSKTRESTSLT